MNNLNALRQQVTGPLAIATVGAISLIGCGSNHEADIPTVRVDITTTTDTLAATTTTRGAEHTTTPTTETARTVATVAAPSIEAAFAAMPTDSTDQSLRDANFKCGGEMGTTSLESFTYKFDFFGSHEDNRKLAKNLRYNLVEDTEWGMGKDAFGVIKDNAFPNGTTHNAKRAGQTTGDADMDVIIDRIFSLKLDSDLVMLNGDCRNRPNDVTMPSPDIPTIRIKKGSTVEGMIIPADKRAELEKSLPKYADGSPKFELVPLRTKDATGKEIDVVFVVAFANGCDNPTRKLPKTPSANPSTTASSLTTLPNTPTTRRIPPKVDPGKIPGDGTPASGDPGTPDAPGSGPAGQETSPNGTVAGESLPTQTTSTAPNAVTTTHPNTTLPTATTGAQHATTTVTAAGNGTSTTAQTGPKPTKP